GEDAVAFAVVGAVADAELRGPRPGVACVRRALHGDGAADALADPRDRPQQGGRPGAELAGEADDLALAHLQRHGLADAGDGEFLELEVGLAELLRAGRVHVP